MSVIAQQESLVKESLFQFITANFPTADLYVIDDIVLSYVISLLEEASGDISFDAEGFIEMMAAYIPEFAQVDSRCVMNWVMELEAKLSNNNAEPDSLSNHGDSVGSNLSINLTLHHLCDATASAPAVKSNRSHSNSESSECSEPRRKELITEEGQWSREWAALSEMFPNSPVMEIKHCVSIAHGDLERAAATLLHRREQGQALSAASMHVSRHQAIDDCELKNRIIARYSYVDKNSDLKEHKPLAPKIEPKKMVRYRDNKIVSLKGERYTEVPKAGAEEENLKKPKRQHCP